MGQTGCNCGQPEFYGAGVGLNNIIKGRRVFHGTRANTIYQFLGHKYAHADKWKFMNYGFAYHDPNDQPILYPADEADRFSIHLYHIVASQLDLTGKCVIDVGSGRGGGASYVQRYLGPKTTTGLDLASSAVAFCRRVYAPVPGLFYQVGDAMNLPLADASVDAVLNVESAHCYPDKAAFLAEALRVLRPGGSLLLADFSRRNQPMDDLIDRAGFAEIVATDITANITRGLLTDDARRREFIRDHVPFGFRRAVQAWAAAPGSWIFDDFKNGRRCYVVYRATKAG